MKIRQAEARDVAALTRLINAAFAVERPFIEGNRVDEIGAGDYMVKGKFLIAEDAAGMAACVYCELRGERGYLGLLGVEPRVQGTGLGRRMMQAAEDYFREAGCKEVELRVVNLREELPAFYRHLGYRETGIIEHPPVQVPAKVPLHFVQMLKML
jgi:GNAT superfamily N-acetyltransferase